MENPLLEHGAISITWQFAGRSGLHCPEVGGDDDLPDARDGLTRKERVVLLVLDALERERGTRGTGRSVPVPMIYGRVLEHVDMSVAELQRILQRLAGRGPHGT